MVERRERGNPTSERAARKRRPLQPHGVHEGAQMIHLSRLWRTRQIIPWRGEPTAYEIDGEDMAVSPQRFDIAHPRIARDADAMNQDQRIAGPGLIEAGRNAACLDEFYQHGI